MIRARIFTVPRTADHVEGVRLLAILSLAAWAGAIGTGRFLAYTYTRLSQSF
jgi:hypothetical protein